MACLAYAHHSVVPITDSLEEEQIWFKIVIKVELPHAREFKVVPLITG